MFTLVQRPLTSRWLRIGLASAGLLLWSGAVVAAFDVFWREAATPGRQGVALSRGAPDPGDVAVVSVFLHPKCPCSRATLAELARVAAVVDRPVRYRIFFDTDSAQDQTWTTTALYDQAQRIPQVELLADPSGVFAERFGAETSGHVVAYRADGTLMFAGGITGSRGHEGDNDGKSRLIAALRSSSKLNDMHAPVYGCGLSNISNSQTAEVLP